VASIHLNSMQTLSNDTKEKFSPATCPAEALAKGDLLRGWLATVLGTPDGEDTEKRKLDTDLHRLTLIIYFLSVSI
jgi:hypothetical protein